MKKLFPTKSMAAAFAAVLAIYIFSELPTALPGEKQAEALSGNEPVAVEVETDSDFEVYLFTPDDRDNRYQDTQADVFQAIPEYSGNPYYEIGEADFNTERTPFPFVLLCELDNLDRPGWVLACLGPETLATEDRGSIGMFKPTGWKQNKYDSIKDEWNPAGFLYNRCHLLGFQLLGRESNTELNLITGTRYMNVDGMLPFENMVADYIRATGNHVAYMVTPYFEGDNLVATGVRIEAKSYEDDGKGINFDVFCYNVQPGIEIDYATGNNRQN